MLGPAFARIAPQGAAAQPRTAAAPAQKFLAAAPLAAEGAPSSGAATLAASVVGGALLAGRSAGDRRSRRGAAKTRTRVATVDTRAPAIDEYVSLCNDSDGKDTMRVKFEAMIAKAQDDICCRVAELDGGAEFSYERYLREAGKGGGIARVLQNGNVFEKAGVNLSVVYGEMPQEALRAATERGTDRVGKQLAPGEKVPFFACGLSSVMHPKNPHCPTMHFNYRYFETEYGTWWFGGGTDITPSYLDVDDMKHFHGTYKTICNKYEDGRYAKFKEWADNYFKIGHRGETRGLGGIFFDDFNTDTPERHLAFSEECVNAVCDSYLPILKKNKDMPFTNQQKEWQQMRRGRYVEFNLVYDRGTIFGLKMLSSGVGRIESILMSLPETARWGYCHEPEPNSPEAEIMDAFKNPREWV
mmetsp:Transcript_13783/g.36496  ORF Transcript_13783/g.36496 Transcript_13783/m.36496 type:complete len:414 (-) Transcript_13783:109-1350(-)